MASTLQIVDPDNSSNVLFDLNDSTATNSGLYGSVKTALVGNPDFGTPKLESSSLDTGSRTLQFNRQAIADFTLNVRIYGASSYDNLNKGLGVLANYLMQGCVMKWIPDGSSETRFIDVMPSATPVLLDGRELGLYEVTKLFDTPQGVTLKLQRLGYLRAAKLDPATNYLSNGTLLRDSDGDGIPDNWVVLTAATTSISAATQSQRCTTTATQRGIRQDTGAASAASGDTFTLSCEARLVAGAAMLSLDFRNSSNTGLGTTSVSITSSSFQRYTVTATAPATTDHVRARLESNSGSTSTWDSRNVQLEKASSATPFRVKSETLASDPTASGFTHLLPVYNPSDAPAPCEITLAFPDSGSAIVEADYALLTSRNITGSRYLSDYLNGPYYANGEASGNGWTVTLDSTVTSTGPSADASASNYALIAHSSSTAMKKRITWTRTTLLDSLRGRWRVYARAFPGGQMQTGVQLVWGTGTTATVSNEEVYLDATAWRSGSEFVYLDLGTIDIPLETNVAVGQLTLELWTEYVSGSVTNLAVDYLAFVPTDDSVVALVDSASKVSIQGSLLTTPPFNATADPGAAWVAGAVSGSAMRLNAANEAAGMGDNTNGFYTGVTNGKHRSTYQWRAHPGAGGSISVVASLVNITDDTVVASSTYTYTSAASQTVIIDAADTNAKKYQPRVYVSARTAPAYVDVELLSVESRTGLTQNAKIRSDPGSLPTRSAVEALDSSGNLDAAMSATGAPFWLPPGLSLLWVQVFELMTVESGDYNRSRLARTLTVSPAIYPRYWQ